jgi:hypothetical protein
LADGCRITANFCRFLLNIFCTAPITIIDWFCFPVNEREMSENNLPGYLKKVLEHHVSESSLNDDDELRSIVNKLDKLRDTVASLKAQAKAKKSAAITR